MTTTQGSLKSDRIPDPLGAESWIEPCDGLLVETPLLLKGEGQSLLRRKRGKSKSKWGMGGPSHLTVQQHVRLTRAKRENLHRNALQQMLRRRHFTDSCRAC